MVEIKSLPHQSLTQSVVDYVLLQVGGSHDLRVTSPGSPSCCGSCCEAHQTPLQGARSVSSYCSAPSCRHSRHQYHHVDHHPHHPHHPHHHRAHHHRRQRGSRLAATSASSCSSSSPPSSPPHSLRRYPLPAPPAHINTSVAPGQPLTASPFELRRLPVIHPRISSHSFARDVHNTMVIKFLRLGGFVF